MLFKAMVFFYQTAMLISVKINRSLGGIQELASPKKNPKTTVNLG